MGRFLIEEIRDIESTQPDPNALSASLVRLILSSRQVEAKVHGSDASTGAYVVVLEGTLEIGEREWVAIVGRPAAPAPRPGARRPATERLPRGPLA